MYHKQETRTYDSKMYGYPIPKALQTKTNLKESFHPLVSAETAQQYSQKDKQDTCYQSNRLPCFMKHFR